MGVFMYTHTLWHYSAKWQNGTGQAQSPASVRRNGGADGLNVHLLEMSLSSDV